LSHTSDSSNKENSKPSGQERPSSLEMIQMYDVVKAQPVRKNRGESLYSPVMNRNWFGSQPMPGVGSQPMPGVGSQPIGRSKRPAFVDNWQVFVGVLRGVSGEDDDDLLYACIRSKFKGGGMECVFTSLDFLLPFLFSVGEFTFS
jgi:hypothetical protein